MRSWAFERAARKRVKAEVDASKKLRKERRLARSAARGRYSVSPIYSVRPIFIRIGALGAVGVGLVGASFRTVEYIVAVTLLWTLSETFWRGVQFRIALYDDPGLIVFDYLPISDEEIFRVQWKRFLRSTGWGYFCNSLAYGMLLAHAGLGWHAVPGGMALGAVQWLFSMAMAVCLVAFAQPKHVAALAWPLRMAVILLLMFGVSEPLLCQWLSGLAWCVPPLGWILQSLGVSNNNGLFHRVLPGLMSAAVLALSPFAYRRVRQAFLSSEPKHSSDGRTKEVVELGERLAQSPDETRAATEAREFLTGFNWQKEGVLERFFASLLNTRERPVAEIILGGIPRWGITFKRSFLFLLVIAILMWPWRSSFGSVSPSILIILLSSFLSSFVTSLRGFTLPPGSGLTSPYYANYPIGFWELTRVALKINLLKTLIFLPYVIIVCLYFGEFQLSVAGNGLKWIFLALTAQPLLVIGAISPNTNDTRKPGLVFVVIAIGLVMLGAGITFFLVTTWWIAVLSGFFMAALSILELVLYGRWFDRSRFDLVPLKRSDIQIRA